MRQPHGISHSVSIRVPAWRLVCVTSFSWRGHWRGRFGAGQVLVQAIGRPLEHEAVAAARLEVDVDGAGPCQLQALCAGCVEPPFKTVGCEFVSACFPSPRYRCCPLICLRWRSFPLQEPSPPQRGNGMDPRDVHHVRLGVHREQPFLVGLGAFGGLGWFAMELCREVIECWNEDEGWVVLLECSS
jgi:hypothetical protein